MRKIEFTTEDTIHFVYGLICPISNEIIYVGHTCNISNRLMAHVNLWAGSKLGNHVDMLKKKKLNKNLKMVVLEECADLRSVQAAEKDWIVKLSKTHTLLNKIGVPKSRPDYLTIAEYENLSGKKVNQ